MKMKQAEGKKGEVLKARQSGAKPLLDGGPKGKENVRRLLGVMGKGVTSWGMKSVLEEFVSAADGPGKRKEVIDELKNALWGCDPNAATVLGHLKAVEALEDLIRAADGTLTYRTEFRKNAIDALGMLGDDAEYAIPALMTALDDYNLTRSAVNALAKMGPKGVRVLAGAVRVSANHIRTRVVAAGTLGSMGKDAESALPELEKRTRWWRERDGSVRQAARDAIEKIKKDMGSKE